MKLKNDHGILCWVASPFQWFTNYASTFQSFYSLSYEEPHLKTMPKSIIPEMPLRDFFFMYGTFSAYRRLLLPKKIMIVKMKSL